MRLRAGDVLRLIPQRDPFVMVDAFEPLDGQTAATVLHVRSGNYFLLPDATLAETGLIEHIAQSCSALAAALKTDGGGQSPPVGMVVELRHFTCSRRPHLGETLTTRVTFTLTLGPMTLAHGTSHIAGELLAELDLKIYMQ